MADDTDTSTTTAVSQPVSYPLSNPVEVIKALLQSGQPATPLPGLTDTAATTNPWLKQLEQETSPPSTAPYLGALEQPQVPAAKGGEISAQSKKAETPRLDLPKPVPIPQLPMSTVLQMQQHQVNPQVEAARQRVVQALLAQRPHGVVPQPPVAKG